MLRRQLRCPSCGASWERRTARFCGACGAALDADDTTDREDRITHPSDVDASRVSPRTLLLGGLAVIALIAGLLTADVDLGTPPAADDDVALPDELDTPAQLTPDQRESLERFDPDRLRCEPHDCEVARLPLDHAAPLVGVGLGWLAVLDGSVLRVRPLENPTSSGEDPKGPDEDPTNPGEERTSPSAHTAEQHGGPSAHHDVPTEEPVAKAASAEVAGGGAIRGRSEPDGGGVDHDLSDRFAPITPPGDATEDNGADHLDIIATPPEQLTVLADGSVVLRWFDRLARIDLDGTLRWDLSRDDRTFRHLEVVEDRFLVLRDDLPWPDGTTGPRAAPDPVLATAIDPDDGQELWGRYTLSPRDVMGDGLLVTTVDGAIEMIDMASGTTRWRRSRSSSERLQSTSGPWLILTRPDRAFLVDPRTGDDVAVRERTALFTPLQSIEDLWVAAWLEGSGGGTTDVSLVALNDQGDEQWSVPLRGIGGGACCPAVIPWGEDTLAVFDPGGSAPQWLLVDTRSGGLVGLPEKDRPRLPLPYDASDRIFVPDRGGGRLLQLAEDRAALLTVDGEVRVQGSLDLEVVSVDPFVVVQDREVLVARPVPGG